MLEKLSLSNVSTFVQQPWSDHTRETLDSLAAFVCSYFCVLIFFFNLSSRRDFEALMCLQHLCSGHPSE